MSQLQYHDSSIKRPHVPDNQAFGGLDKDSLSKCKNSLQLNAFVHKAAQGLMSVKHSILSDAHKAPFWSHKTK